jgi:hypothetical protein
MNMSFVAIHSYVQCKLNLRDFSARCGTLFAHSKHTGWNPVMSSAEEYRLNAEECLGWAKKARSGREREIFLQMAETWLQAATSAAIKEGTNLGQKNAPSRSRARLRLAPAFEQSGRRSGNNN